MDWSRIKGGGMRPDILARRKDGTWIMREVPSGRQNSRSGLINLRQKYENVANQLKQQGIDIDFDGFGYITTGKK